LQLSRPFWTALGIENNISLELEERRTFFILPRALGKNCSGLFDFNKAFHQLAWAEMSHCVILPLAETVRLGPVLPANSSRFTHVYGCLA